MKPRWNREGVLTWGSSVVGTVQESPNGWWYAYGCEDDWQDVALGGFKKETEAKRAVEKWVKENCQ